MLLFHKIGGVDCQRTAFFWRRLDQKRPANGVDKFLYRVEGIEGVLGPGVERVALESPLELCAAFLNFSDTHQLNTELSPRAPKIRRQLDRATSIVHRFGIATIFYRKLRQRIEDLAGVRIDRKRAFDLGVKIRLSIRGK